ncbi:MAG: carboxypeptidase-like regulatory domain-containing protein [Gemmatimonadota bacterium]
MFTSRLSGVVRGQDGRPVRSAELTLLPLGLRAISGVAGEFAFVIPSGGRFTLHVAAAGHVPVSFEELDLPRGAVMRQEVSLTPRQPTPVTRVWRDGMAHRASVR